MLNALMNDLQKAVIDVPTSDIPVLIGELEKLRVTLWARIAGEMVSQKNNPIIDESLLSIPQVAERLKIPVARCYELARHQDGLPTIRLGKSLRVSPTELTEWLGQQKKGLDKKLASTYSAHHARYGIKTTAKTSRVDPAAVGHGGRRDGELHRTARTGRNGHQGTSCSVGAGVRPTGAEK